MKIKDIESALNEKVEAKALELAQEKARKLTLLKAQVQANIAVLETRVKKIDKAIEELDTEDFKMAALEQVSYKPNLGPFEGIFGW